MKILITGSQGYIGTFLTRFLSDNGIQVSGMDVGYYKDCNLIPVDDLMSTKCIDVRDIGIDDVIGWAKEVSAIISRADGGDKYAENVKPLSCEELKFLNK